MARYRPVAMDPHRLAEERSLAYHRVVAARLAREPRLVEEARELRQSSPFAGALSPRERWRIWREVRARLDRVEEVE